MMKNKINDGKNLKPIEKKKQSNDIEDAKTRRNLIISFNILFCAILVMLVLINIPIQADFDESNPEATDNEETSASTNANYYVVSFKVDDHIYHEETVLEGTLVPTPSTPTSDLPFYAWFYENTDLVFNSSDPIIANVNLVARFGERYIVRFMNLNGSELEVFVVNKGDAIPKPSNAPILPMGIGLLYWHNEGEDEAFDFSSAANRNLKLYPITNRRASAVFITGGPEIEPQTGNEGFYASLPDAQLLVRDSHTFSHWSSTPNGIEPFNFEGTPILGTTFIYAVWIPEKVGYIINYWNERANIVDPGDPREKINRTHYELVYTKPMPAVNGGVPGEPPKISEQFANEEYISGGTSVTELLDYSDFEWANETPLSEFGNTIINIYYKRTKYNFYFDLTQTFKGKEIVSWIFLRGRNEPIYGDDGIYKLENVKLGQDISTLWPYKVERENTTEKPISWNAYFGNGSTTLGPNYMQQGMNSGKPGRPPTTTAILRMNWQNAAYSEIRHYYLEVPSGQEADSETVAFTAKGGDDLTERYYKWSESSTTGYQSANPVTNAVNWPGRAIQGFETITTSLTRYFQDLQLIGVENGVSNYRINYFMRRLYYDLTLVVGGGVLEDATGFVNNDGNYMKQLQFGSSIALSEKPQKPNAIFKGWYLDDLFQNEFSNGIIMPSRNLTLYAKYIGTDVMVLYFAGGILPVKINTYSFNEPLIMHDLLGTNYEDYAIGDVVPGKGIFRGWYYKPNSTDITVEFPLGMRLINPLYIIYADFEPVNYKVNFISKDDHNASYVFKETIVPSGNRNTLALQGYYESEFVPTRQGYTFMGWNTKEYGAGDSFFTATRILEDIVVYAKWTPKTYTVNFESNGGDRVGSLVASYGSKIVQPNNPQKKDYEFRNWYIDKELKIPWKFDLDTVVSNTTLYAKWEEINPSNSQPEEPNIPDNEKPVKESEPEKITDSKNTEIGEEDHILEIIDEALPEAFPEASSNIVYNPTSMGVWAILNLISCLCGIVMSAIMVIPLFSNKKHNCKSEEENRQEKYNFSRIMLSTVPGIVGIVIFLITEDMNNKMVLADKWTFVMLLLLLMGMVNLLQWRKMRKAA